MVRQPGNEDTMQLPLLNWQSLTCLPSNINNVKVSPTTTAADWYST